MKDLLEAGACSKIQYGVKILSKGAEKLKEIGKPIHLEVSDASTSSIEAIKNIGGSLKVKYRTPLLMRYHLKPHKFKDYKELKTPMPPPKRVKKLELLREKGLEVEYPRAPWYTDNKEALLAEAAEKERRIREGQHADLLPKLPADRSPGVSKDKPKIQKKVIIKTFKLPL